MMPEELRSCMNDPTWLPHWDIWDLPLEKVTSSTDEEPPEEDTDGE